MVGGAVVGAGISVVVDGIREDEDHVVAAVLCISCSAWPSSRLVP